jgi:hypothetical protein
LNERRRMKMKNGRAVCTRRRFAMARQALSLPVGEGNFRQVVGYAEDLLCSCV